MRLINADEILLNDESEYTKTMLEVDDTVKTIITAVHNNIQTLIQKALTIDAEIVRHGKWEKVKCNTILDKAVFSHALKCSECGKWKFENLLITQKFYYCPNCGAKMDGGEEDA